MNTNKELLIFLVSAVIVVALAQPGLCALDTEVVSGDVSIIQVDKTAPGTKLSGQITIYYEETGRDEFNRIIADMHVFLRLRKGYTLYPFSTIIRDLIYKASEVPDQQSEVEQFIANTVIPVIYPDYAPNYPSFAVKNVDQVVQDDDTLYPGCCNDDLGNRMYFTIMDVVIAVQD